MAEKKRFLDVWIIEANTVYREVPYTVVLDWIQQGRLLEEDQVRPSGTRDWQRVGESAGLSPYVPKAEPLRANDQAEALEPVELDFHWHRPTSEEDDEVDMIPLIDVSMVLLVFFMLTASGAGTASFIAIPTAESAPVADTSGIWVGINLKEEKGKERTLVYSIGEEGKAGSGPNDDELLAIEVSKLPKDGKDRSYLKPVLDRLATLLDHKTGQVNVTINAHKDVDDGWVVDLTREMSEAAWKGKIKAKYIGVAEKTQ